MTTDTLHSSHPRRLTRSASDKKLGGVAAGLGAYFSVDPILFRVGFAAATLLSGVGLLAYLALMAFVPSAGGAPSRNAHPMPA